MTQKRGLTKKVAEQKLKQYGPNEIKDSSKITPFKILLRQIKNNFIVYLLLFATIISFIVGKNVTGVTIIVIIFVVISAGFIQEYRAEKSLSALKNLLVPVSTVIRDGIEQEINSTELVPEDIILLRIGEKIPADALIIEERNIRVNESILTGESTEVSKKAGSTNQYDNENLVFMGTYLVNGKCIAKIIHTGMNTKFGKIAKLISTTEKELPLQKKVNKIAKYLSIIGVIISIITGILILTTAETIDKDTIINIMILVIALSVAAFPEAFPVVLISTLSAGAHRMAKKNAIVNRMSIIETLGETTVICSDKTGTITKGEMTVKKIYSNNIIYEVTGVGYEGEGSFFHNKKEIDITKIPCFNELFYNAVLCNDSRIERTGEDEEYRSIGSPTETALLVMAAKANIFRDDIPSERIQENPFSSEIKMMSVLCKVNKENIVYAKGAPEYLLNRCKFIQKNNKIVRLTEKEKKKILETNNSMTLSALRTLAFAYQKVTGHSKNHLEKDLIFTGLIGMEDPPREEVKEAIAHCRTAGIKIKMITGDNKETAIAIAKEIGLKGRLMEGRELDNITDYELTKIIDSIAIFARVKPIHKLRIVKSLKNNGEIVTMTGDGVNDAPALKEAHIGVAMGKNGTDVSRSVADLTLKDDHFSTIVLAIKEGRTIFKNIRKAVTYQLSCNVAELSILFFGVILAPFFGWTVPILLALQILFMNLVTADLPAISLGLNPYSSDTMKEQPRKHAEILNKPLVALLVITGVIMTFMVLSTYYLTYNILGIGIEYSRTIALTTLILFELTLAFNFRSFRKGTINRGLFVNKYLFYAAAISIALTLVIIYTPINIIFETVPITLYGWLIPLVLSLVLILIFDILKYANSKLKLINFELHQ